MENRRKPKLAIIIPCYNEQEALHMTIDRLTTILYGLINQSKVASDSFIYLIDDGSKDNTWEIIANLHKKNAHFYKGLKFTRNFGNQNALIAGLNEVNKLGVDCILSIDADLQQDETKIEEFVQKYTDGADIVCGVRNNRKTDSVFKKYPALFFYKIMNLLGVKIKPNHSDYRLVGKKALDILGEYKEVNMFLRGIFYELGLKTEYVYFDVKKREFGTSKYNLFSLFKLALHGITSFSVVPLRIVSIMGFVLSLTSFLLCLQVIYERIFNHNIIPGWATIVFVVCFIGGIQIFSIGIIGEYLGQLFQEVKARPRYIKEIELV